MMRQLPNDEIGISDILDYRECAQRAAWKMRRHTPLPERFQLFEGEKDEPPEATDWTNAYGSACHEAISIVEREQVTDEAAIDRVWATWQHWLEPDDLERLRKDLATYHTRTHLGYRLVAAEKDMRVPLFEHEGRMIYFRFKVDALYQSLANPSVFLMRDYKTSRHKKSVQEVHTDLQQWAYNFGIHDLMPEVGTLVQLYDQLRFGVEPTRKSPQQRRQIRDWLIREIKAILTDDVMRPTMNDYCQYCPLLMDCRVTHRAGPYWIKRLAALAPERKQGRKIIVELSSDEHDFEDYLEALPEAVQARKMIARFEETVKDVLKQMPQEERERLGWEISGKSREQFTGSALRQIVDIVGIEEFVHLVSLSKTSVEQFYGKSSESDTARAILGLAERVDGSVEVRPKRG